MHIVHFTVHCKIYCTLYSIPCAQYCTLYSVQCTKQCTVYSIECMDAPPAPLPLSLLNIRTISPPNNFSFLDLNAMYNLLCRYECPMYSVQCTVYNVQCTMYNVQYTMYSFLFTVYRTVWLPHLSSVLSQQLSFRFLTAGSSQQVKALVAPDS